MRIQNSIEYWWYSFTKSKSLLRPDDAIKISAQYLSFEMRMRLIDQKMQVKFAINEASEWKAKFHEMEVKFVFSDGKAKRSQL